MFNVAADSQLNGLLNLIGAVPGNIRVNHNDDDGRWETKTHTQFVLPWAKHPKGRGATEDVEMMETPNEKDTRSADSPPILHPHWVSAADKRVQRRHRRRRQDAQNPHTRRLQGTPPTGGR